MFLQPWRKATGVAEAFLRPAKSSNVDGTVGRKKEKVDWTSLEE